MTNAASRPGVVAREWADAARQRHVLVEAGLRPCPWPSMQSRREKRGQKYHDWRETTRLHVLAALRVATVTPWLVKGERLGLACAFGAAPRRDPAESRSISIWDWDLRNLEKAIEDVLSGILYHDDAQIRYSGPGSARDDREDWFYVHVWDGDQRWNPAWAHPPICRPWEVIG